MRGLEETPQKPVFLRGCTRGGGQAHSRLWLSREKRGLPNIPENRKDFHMALLKIRTTTIKNDEGITAKGDCCPVNELLENQIF